MITFKPFKAVCPTQENAREVAALPYDVFNSSEAKEEVANKPLSFLRIDRAETNFDDSVGIYSDQVYEKASSLLREWIKKNILVPSEVESFYLYELSTTTHTQTGLVGLTAIQDLVNGSIRDHEKTRTEKQTDRTKHIDACQAHTGPILMFHQDQHNFGSTIESLKNELQPIISFTSDDSITHRVFALKNKIHHVLIDEYFKQLDTLYIADGHHRAAAAKAIAFSKNQGKISDTNVSSNLFLSVVFPSTQLKILDYNRVVKDLNGLSPSKFLEAIKKDFEILHVSDHIIHPTIKGQLGMNLDNQWYLLSYKHRRSLLKSPIELLDVSILQNYILTPLLGIVDPVVDTRIDFVGGSRGLEAIEERLSQDCVLGFALVPTTISELIQISDLGQLMPPKSTWFEPKLRSGLFIHLID